MDKSTLKSLDMYECQLLHDEYAKVYIRKGKCFIYIGDNRYEVSPLSKEDQWDTEDVSKTIKTSNLDFSKDFTYSGKLYFNQNQEGWIFGIINPSNRNTPLVVLRLEKRPTIN